MTTFKIALTLMLLASCATYERLELVSDKLKPLADFASVTTVSGNKLLFKVGEFIDSRKIKDRVGMAKTGLSNTATPIVMQEGSVAYVQARLDSGLKKRGFSLPKDQSNVLKGEIQELWVSEHAASNGTEFSQCNIALALNLYVDGSSVAKWSGTTSVEARSKGTILDVTDTNGAMLESCMNEAIEKLIRDEKFKNLTGIKID